MTDFLDDIHLTIVDYLAIAGIVILFVIGVVGIMWITLLERQGL